METLSKIAKLKLSKQYRALYQEVKQSKGLTAIRKTKEAKAILQQLGLTAPISADKGKDENEISLENLTALEIPDVDDNTQRREAVKDWLKTNLQGKKIITSDGKTVYFNRKKSVDHFTFDSSKKEFEGLGFAAVAKIPEVFAKGQFIERKTLTKKRNDDFVAFHTYRKMVELGDKKVELQVKAGERNDGSYEVVGSLIGYTFWLYSNGRAAFPNTSTTDSDSGNLTTAIPQRNSSSLSSEIGTRKEELVTTDSANSTLILDNVQAEDYLVEILRVWDKDGNEITPTSELNNRQALIDLLQSTIESKLLNDERLDEILSLAEPFEKDDEIASLLDRVGNLFVAELPRVA